jgi:peptide/nickel transport system substrate-binding protein
MMCRPAVESLARYDETGALTPWLATSWTTDPDALTMTLNLRQGVKFHDGTDFNADAVKFNLDRFRESTRGEIRNVQSVEVVDPYTVLLTLSAWDSTIDGAVLYFAGNMISPTAFQAHDKEWAEQNPVGTGPFKFVSWERDVSIEYERNADYWQAGKPYLDGIEFVIIADSMVRLAAFEKGEVDVLERVDVKDVEALKAAGKYDVQSLHWAGLGLMALVPDSGHPDSPFADLKVRQAAAYAIDAQALIDSVLHGEGLPASQYADPNSWANNPAVKAIPYDPEKAKQLLSEAGYANGFTCTIYAKTGPPTEQIATAVQGFLSKVGITAEIDLLSATRFTEVSAEKGWTNALNLLEFRGGPDYALLIPRYFGPKAYNAWLVSVIHPEDALAAMEGAIAARTQAEKQAATWEAQQYLFDKYLICIPIEHGIVTNAKYPYVKDEGIYLADASVWTPEDAWLDK